ncbi:MAG: hypothetical protein KY456_12075 [Chloroflexi bacterium]|nr:hypothetical protein [Chloroflexota bacterium]
MATEQQYEATASEHPGVGQAIASSTQDATRDWAVTLATPRLIPVALSALLEGLGQAYNRQPVKSAGLVAAGLGLSTASGLNTWLMRRVFRAKSVTIGTERIRPWLLAAWAVTYAFSLWDAWAGAPKPDAEQGGPNP